MMGKLGFDIKLSDLNDNEKKFCRDAVTNYNHLKPVVLEGDMYRLVSPYSGNHTSTQYVGKIRRELLSLHSIFTPVMARNCCLSVCKDWTPTANIG